MAEMQPDPRLEIAHVLFMDIVGFSKSLINEQSEMLRQLNQLVRSTAQVKAAEAAGKLIRIPTGDGMALGFFTTPDAPLRCAIEISQALKSLPKIPVRMGINSGPVDEIVDVNERSNLAGTGITMAQRVMDCGDAGHILLSKRSADDLAQYGKWRPHLHELGQCRYHYARLIPPEIRAAMTFYQQAIDRDPKYALAYFGLAEANRSLAITSDVPSKDSLPQAKTAAQKALAIDDSLAEAHASLSFSLVWFDWDWAAAERESQRAITLNPNSAMAHFSHAHLLSDLGRHDEAVADAMRAVELDPLFFLYRAIGALFLHHAGRNEEARVQLEKTFELDPNFWIAHLTLGKVYTQ